MNTTTVNPNDAELARVFEKVNGLCDRYEAVIKSVTDENAVLRGAIQKMGANAGDLAKMVRAEVAGIREAVKVLSKTAAVPLPIRGAARRAD